MLRGKGRTLLIGAHSYEGSQHYPFGPYLDQIPSRTEPVSPATARQDAVVIPAGDVMPLLAAPEGHPLGGDAGNLIARHPVSVGRRFRPGGEMARSGPDV